MDFQVMKNDDEEFIVAYIEGHGLKGPVRSDHPNFAMVKNLLELDPDELAVQDPAEVAALFDPAEAISRRFQSITERVDVRNGTIYFDGDALNNTLSDLIVRLMEEDEDFIPFVLFLENLMENPNEHSRKMAFDWIQSAGDGMAITENGCVVGFKGTASDGKGGFQSTTSGHAIVNGEEFYGRIPYAPNDEVWMPRSEVTFDPNNSCASGLHVGTRSYARSFRGQGGALLEVWVYPRDIVSVPTGEHEKMRVSRFYVAGVVEDDDVIGALRRKDTYVAPTESPYEDDEFGDGEEFVEPSDLEYDPDEEPSTDFGADVDQDEDDEPEAFVGRSVRQPTQVEFDEMAARAKRRHKGRPGTASFATYASTVGGWSFRSDTDGNGESPADWTLPVA